MSAYWDELPIHVIDFEGGHRCGIVEFGVVTLRGASIESTATRLCRPEKAIPKNEEAVHGISSRMARSEASFSEEWERFASLRESGPMAAHFAAAENAMIKSVFPFPRSSPNWLDEGRETVDWGPWIDTGVLYRELGEADRSNKLEDLVRGCALQDELDELGGAYCPADRCRYHCALYDALASALLLAHYCQSMCDERVAMVKLLAASQGNALKRQRIEQRELF